MIPFFTLIFAFFSPVLPARSLHRRNKLGNIPAQYTAAVFVRLAIFVNFHLPKDQRLV
jgi:hypothetical protein